MTAAREFAGNVAVVTGGGAGIGFAVARAFARAGAHVAIAGRTQATLSHAAAAIEEASGQPVLVIAADVGAPADCERIVAATVERFGALDILVNNAAYFALVPLLEADAAEAAGFLNVNVAGALLCARAFAAHAIARGRGGRDRQREQHFGRAAGAGLRPLFGLEGGARQPHPLDGARMGARRDCASTRSRRAMSPPKA